MMLRKLLDSMPENLIKKSIIRNRLGEIMTIYEDNRRVVSRCITFIDKKILLIERFKKTGNEMLHYYTIPGGGVEVGEDYLDAAVRETKEETCCDVQIISFLQVEDYPNGRCYWFYGKYLSGMPMLGGEEKERNTADNFYKVVLVPFEDLDKINILGIGKELIKKCIEKYK